MIREEKLTEDDLKLRTGEPLGHASMCAPSKAQSLLVTSFAVDVERIGVGKDVLVAIG